MGEKVSDRDDQSETTWDDSTEAFPVVLDAEDQVTQLIESESELRTELEIVRQGLTAATTVVLRLKSEMDDLQAAYGELASKLDRAELETEQVKAASRYQYAQTRKAIGSYWPDDRRWGWVDMWTAIAEMRDEAISARGCDFDSESKL